MRFHLSGSDLGVNFAPIPQCTPSRSDSSSDGACVVWVNTWRQAWLLCCTLVQWLVAVVALLLNGVKTVPSQVRGMTRRFVLAAESAVLCVRDTSRICWLRVIDVVAGSMGAMQCRDAVLLSSSSSVAVHSGVLVDTVGVVTPGAFQRSAVGAGLEAGDGEGVSWHDAVDGSPATKGEKNTSAVSTSEPSDVVLTQQVVEIAELAIHHAVNECECGAYVDVMSSSQDVSIGALGVDAVCAMVQELNGMGLECGCKSALAALQKW